MKNRQKLILVLSIFLVQACSSGRNTGEFIEYDMPNAAAPQQNLVTGGQPSSEDFERLAKRGTKVIVNLRTKGENKGFNEKQIVEKLGMRYVSIEIDGSDGITLANAKRLDDVLNQLAEPALVHCASSNRVGGLLAFREYMFQNKSAEDALAFGKLAGMRSTQKRVKKLIAKK